MSVPIDADRPHVLLVTVDHWPASLLGCAGHPAIETPTLDRLAENGVRFENAYSECPVCIPARRTLMTGLSPRSHGDRTFQTTLGMPAAPTLAQSFRDAGYRSVAVGKLHVYPQRDRIGFDEVQLCEEGRPYWGVYDDYEIHLADEGFAGQQFDHGMSNNEYVCRPWHLPERTHPTSWAARTMSREIRRRDPTRPGFWYLSFTHPHPPLVPPRDYWDMYRSTEVPAPPSSDWSQAGDQLPYRLQVQAQQWPLLTPAARERALRAFYALCTHIDHQLRLVIGTLREEGLLDRTIILFTADHGDMLGQHGLWAKRLFYEPSANVPMVLVPAQGDSQVRPGSVDRRLAGLQDVMPTLLEMARVEPPEQLDGRSLVTGSAREHLYGECNEDAMASRMIRCGRHKLIYYPAGNRSQLFDLDSDPDELHDLAGDPRQAETLQRLQSLLRSELYGSDLDWVQSDQLVGCPVPPVEAAATRDLLLQRGVHWPPPPQQVVKQEPNRLR